MKDNTLNIFLQWTITRCK